MLDEHLTFEKTMKMKIDDYKNANIPHIRVARKIASRGFSRVGDRITWVVTRADSSTVEEPVIKGEPFPKIFKSGYDYYWGRIIDLVKRMIPNFIDDIRDEVTIDAFT
jgi:DNA polymerase elongation subunit (family B)